MSDIRERFKLIRIENNLSQEEYGKSIGIKSRAHISALENGTRNITDRIINDTCNKYCLNEDWLRKGIGPKYKDIEDKLSAYVSEITDGDDEFIKTLIKIYMELTPSSKKALHEILDGITNTMKKRD